MKNKKRICAWTALLTFFLGSIIFIFGLFTIGLFSRDKIVVTALATTGPDYEVFIGQLKLKMQMPDTVETTDVSGVMITDESSKFLVDYLNKNSFWKYQDYYVLTTKVVGAKRSDSQAFHPLVEVYACRHINKILFWITVTADMGLLLIFGMLYKKYKQ